MYGVPGIQLGNGRIKGPLPGAQGDDSDPRAAIVGQDVPQSPRGFLWAAHPESFRTRHRSVPFSGTRPRFAALILLLAQRPPLQRAGCAAGRWLPPGHHTRHGDLSGLPSSTLAPGDAAESHWSRNGPSGWVGVSQCRKQRPPLQRPPLLGDRG